MIYDCFTFFNELDMLEIRLNILDKYVDYFAMVEGNKTHTGGNKEFVFEKNKDRFKKFLDKIIYIKVEDFPPLESSNSDSFGNKWLYENYQRDAIMRGLTNCKDDDIIFISDCDEIWNPKVLKRCKDKIYSLKQFNCSYNFNTFDLYAMYSKKAKMCRYKNLINPNEDIKLNEYCQFSKKGLPTYLRFCKGKNLFNSGWHFSYIGEIENIILKRKSIVEQQFNTSDNMDYEHIRKMIEEGKDILERDVKLVNIIPNLFLPKFLIQNKEKYSKFINQKKNIPLFLAKIKLFLSKIYCIRHEHGNINNRPILKILGIKIKLRKKAIKVNQKDKEQFLDYILNQQLDNSFFVEDSKEGIKETENNPRLIAFYLPQYHAIPENDKWFLKGFTEWFNVTKTTPQFLGHYQPHLPIDVGFYSLDNLDVMKRQIELAKKYGIGGFCFYYYWFNGQKLLEKPIENFLKDKSLNMPFCLFWDSSHWTQTWNGGSDKQIMYEQKIAKDTAKRFMDDFIEYAKDSRYIKIDNKPIFVISSPNTFEKEKLLEFIEEIRLLAKKSGFDDLYLMSLKGNISDGNFKYFKFDAILEFMPLGIDGLISDKSEKIINKKFDGKIYDVDNFIKNKRYFYNNKFKTFKSCFTNWDNTARKCYRKGRVFQSNPKNYKIWLKDLIGWTKRNLGKNEQFVFINAWNEWAEGAHLEPDQKYGYAYLKATKEALEES